MRRISEEWCGCCGTTFETKKIRSKCPHCKETVISCNNCSMPEGCKDCFKGNEFKEVK